MLPPCSPSLSVTTVPTTTQCCHPAHHHSVLPPCSPSLSVTTLLTISVSTQHTFPSCYHPAHDHSMLPPCSPSLGVTTQLLFTQCYHPSQLCLESSDCSLACSILTTATIVEFLLPFLTSGLLNLVTFHHIRRCSHPACPVDEEWQLAERGQP